MTFPRDLAWQNLEMVYRTSISHQFARYALGLRYDALPANVIHQAKRCLLDALGCAIGAYDAPGRPICEKLARDLGGPEEATVFGSGMRTSAPNATIVNSFMVRYLDYNDCGGGGHNSDSIPAILAVAERQKANGRDFLTSLVISYELGERVNEAVKGPVAERKGGRGQWTGFANDSRGGLNAPPALGKLLGLNEEQIANAIGTCTSRNLVLGILDADREENNMTKNLRYGFIAHNAILCCMLAKNGFTGPMRVVEGDSGFRQVVLGGNMDLERMVDFSGWRILHTRHKSLCANSNTQGHIYATLGLVKENDLKPEDIESIVIGAGLRESRHTVTFSKKYPRNGESADHSAFYGNAIAIKERHFGPEAFKAKKYSDPVILDLIERITVVHDPSIADDGTAGTSTITTKDGRRLYKRVEVPHGLGSDPLSDEDLEEKFLGLTTKYLGKDQIKKLREAVWNVEKLDDMHKLTQWMVFSGK